MWSLEITISFLVAFGKMNEKAQRKQNQHQQQKQQQQQSKSMNARSVIEYGR